METGSSTPTSTEMSKKVVTPGTEDLVAEPHDNDVLCGRGGSINSHPGNERFRKLVEKRKRVYLTARFKREKRLIASSIVTEIRELTPSGRFLTKDNKTGQWYDIGDEKARDKTSQALRENAPKIRSEIETEINKQRAEMKRAEEEDASTAHSSAIPPSPSQSYYHPWGGGHYQPFYGYGPPPDAPNYPPPGPYQPYDGHYGYAAPAPGPAPGHAPSPVQESPSHHSQVSSHSHASVMETSSSHDVDNQQQHPPTPASTNQPQPPPYHHHHEPNRDEAGPDSTFATLPSFVSSVPSSIAAWTRNSFSFGAHSQDSIDSHEVMYQSDSKPLPYVHRAEGRPQRVTFRDDYHRATENSRHYHRNRRSSHQYRNGYSSLKVRGQHRSAKPQGHRQQSSHHHRQPRREYQPEYPADEQNNSLLSQVASHIMGSWETPIPCAQGSSDDLALQGPPRGMDEGQEVELVEMMSFEDPIIEEDDDIREDETKAMPPPQERRVEIDWPSRVGSCHTWLPEAPSFFSANDNPLSPADSMEMDQSAAYSCGGSIGGASLCQVFGNEPMIGGTGGPGGAPQLDQKALNQLPSWERTPQLDQKALNQLPSWERTPQLDHKALNQIPSWERSFRSKSPSTICSDMSRDSDIKSIGSDLNSRPATPRNSITQLDPFEGRMRE